MADTMSESLVDTVRRVQREKVAVTDGARDVLEAGETWTRALCARHGLSPEDVDSANRVVADITIPRVLHLAAEDQLPTQVLLAIAHSSGFINGLACGLERRGATE